MYRRVEQSPKPLENFKLSVEGKLSEDNRWVIMSRLMPWEEFEQESAANFSAEMGALAKPFRMALGALIIKEKLGTSDRETVEPISLAEVYRQQLWMSENRQKRIDRRIVSLSQPHVRPIVRGKAGTPVEFGAKLSRNFLR